VRGAAPLSSRTGWREIDTRFADFSRSASPGKHFLAGRLPGLHHIVERPDGIRQVVEEIFLLLTIVRIRRRDWSGSTAGLGGRRKFDRALVEGWEGAGEKPHFSQRRREMGHPAAALCGRGEISTRLSPRPSPNRRTALRRCPRKCPCRSFRCWRWRIAPDPRSHHFPSRLRSSQRSCCREHRTRRR